MDKISIYDFIKKDRIDRAELCSYVSNLNIIRFDAQTMYIFNEEIHSWVLVERANEIIEIRKLFDEKSQKCLFTGTMRDLVSWLRETPNIQKEFSVIDRRDYVVLGNGILDIEKGSLRSINKEDYITNILDVIYLNPEDRDLAVFDDFCDSIFEGDAAKRKLKKKILLQFIAYTISNQYEAKKALFFIGPANCGKSVLLRVISRVIGEDAVSNLSLGNLGDRFAKAELRGKTANISGEIPVTPLSGTAYDTFKGLVGQDAIYAEKKGKDPFMFKFRGTLLYAGNVMPTFSTTDSSDALLSRLAVLYFNNSVDKDKQDLHLEEKLYKSRDSIISAALDELKNLIQNDFIFEEGTDEVELLKDYSESVNTVSTFINHVCELDPDGYQTIEESYKLYTEFADRMAYVPEKKSEFRKKMLADSRIEAGGKHRIDGKNPRACFKGIKSFKNNY